MICVVGAMIILALFVDAGCGGRITWFVFLLSILHYCCLLLRRPSSYHW
jgi:hypothetical protein